MIYKQVTQCRACGSGELQEYFDLGYQPLANKLLATPDETVEKYKLSVLYCRQCSLSQLSLVVNPAILYSDYPYMSSVSKTFSNHCYDMAKKLRGIFGLGHPKVLDIASNDGCLLLEFASCGFDVCGVEPCAQLAMVANNRGIPTINKFWSTETAKEFKNMNVITATNVFAHADDWSDFLEGVHMSLAKNGVFIMEFPHALNLIHKLQFDTIYHEHLAYLLLKPLIEKFKLHGLYIYHVERLPIHGGSLRIYASKRFKITRPSVYMVLLNEKFGGMYDYSTYTGFAYEVACSIKSLRQFICENRGDVVGFCASAKATVILNACKITSNEVPYIVDETPTKQNKFIPGCSIPIVPFAGIMKPKYLMLLAWNFKKELMDKTKHIGCKYVIPIPKVSVE